MIINMMRNTAGLSQTRLESLHKGTSEGFRASFRGVESRTLNVRHSHGHFNTLSPDLANPLSEALEAIRSGCHLMRLPTMLVMS